MDPTELVRQLGVAGGLTTAVILLSYSVYRAMPAYVERYRLETGKLTAKNAQQAESIAKKVNGALAALSLHDIERGLANSKWFQANVIDARLASSHRLGTIESEQINIRRLLDEHVREDRLVHERVRALEIEVTDAKAEIQEVKDLVRDGAKIVTEECKQIRREASEAERRILTAIYDGERRKETRS